MTAPEPFTTDALWSAGEVREQSQQVTGQLDAGRFTVRSETRGIVGRRDTAEAAERLALQVAVATGRTVHVEDGRPEAAGSLPYAAMTPPSRCACGAPARENAYGRSCDAWPTCETPPAVGSLADATILAALDRRAALVPSC